MEYLAPPFRHTDLLYSKKTGNVFTFVKKTNQILDFIYKNVKYHWSDKLGASTFKFLERDKSREFLSRSREILSRNRSSDPDIVSGTTHPRMEPARSLTPTLARLDIISSNLLTLVSCLCKDHSVIIFHIPNFF